MEGELVVEVVTGIEMASAAVAEVVLRAEVWIAGCQDTSQKTVVVQVQSKNA